MGYIIPFTQIEKMIRTHPARARLGDAISPEELKQVIRMLLRSVPVDEAWYRSRYEDVAEAIEAKQYRSARHHFVEEGYFEGRVPSPHELDERWYLARYEDVAQRLKDGDFTSAREHFVKFGYEEGRMPGEHWLGPC